jgi:threonine dehydratase
MSSNPIQKSPRLPDALGVGLAADRLKELLVPTPLVRSIGLSTSIGAEVWLKLESVSLLGSFKLRGAANALMTDPTFASSRKAVTSSTGNHGQGVAYAAARLGGKAHVFLPERPNPEKARKIQALGAEVHIGGRDLDEAKDAAKAFAREEDATFVDDGESPDLINGAGTVGYEIAHQLAKIDLVLVPLGGGCLTSGTAIGVKASQPTAEVIGVQSAQAPSMHLSFQAKLAVEAEVLTHAECLAQRVPARLALAMTLAHVDDTSLVDDRELLSAAKTLALKGHFLAEPGACAPLAYAWKQRDKIKGQRVVLVVSGANCDASTIAAIATAPSLF